MADDGEDGPHHVLSFDEYIATALQLIPGYDATQDMKPSHRFFQTDENRLKVVSKSIAETLLQAMTPSPKEDEFISALKTKIRKKLKLEFEQPLEAAFIGPQGSGKSSTMNCLMDTKDVALVGNSEAITVVPTTYTKYDDDQGSPKECEYVCTIHFWNRDDMQERATMIQDHVQSFVTDSALDAADFDTPERDEVAEHHKAQYEEVCSYIQRLKMLGGQVCNEDDDLKSMVGSTGLHGRIQMLFDQAISTCEPKVFHGGTSCRTTCFGTSTDMKLGLAPYTNGPRTPLVKSIDIASRDLPACGKYIRLTDVPGLGDVNPFRNLLAESYRNTAAAQIVIVHSDRYMTDGTAMEVNRAIRITGDSDRVVLVNTFKDDHAHNEDAVWQTINELCGAGDKIALTMRAYTNTNEEILRSLEDNCDANSGERHEYRKYLADTAARIYMAEKARKFKAWAHHKFLKDGHSIKAFFVCANNYYFSGRKPVQLRHRKLLMPQECGIRELRKHLLSIPADALQEQQDMFVTNTVPSIIDHARLLSNCESTEKILPHLQYQIVQVISEWAHEKAGKKRGRQSAQVREKLRKACEKTTLQTLPIQASSDILAAMETEVNKWGILDGKKIHLSTYKKICMEGGWWLRAAKYGKSQKGQRIETKSASNFMWALDLFPLFVARFENWKSGMEKLTRQIFQEQIQEIHLLFKTLAEMISDAVIGQKQLNMLNRTFQKYETRYLHCMEGYQDRSLKTIHACWTEMTSEADGMRARPVGAISTVLKLRLPPLPDIKPCTTVALSANIHKNIVCDDFLEAVSDHFRDGMQLALGVYATKGTEQEPQEDFENSLGVITSELKNIVQGLPTTATRISNQGLVIRKQLARAVREVEPKLRELQEAALCNLKEEE
ncbi:hypothetical protein ACN47E_009276 [Coniothyrium glycines]